PAFPSRAWEREEREDQRPANGSVSPLASPFRAPCDGDTARVSSEGIRARSSAPRSGVKRSPPHAAFPARLGPAAGRSVVAAGGPRGRGRAEPAGEEALRVADDPQGGQGREPPPRRAQGGGTHRPPQEQEGRAGGQRRPARRPGRPDPGGRGPGTGPDG